MYPANAYVIRLATEEDARALYQLAQLDSQRPLGGNALIGEIDDEPAAAISLTENRVIADPFQRTAQLTQLLRMRASALHAYAKAPSLRDRMRNGVRVSGKWRHVAPAA
jgi:hypothetical protein